MMRLRHHHGPSGGFGGGGGGAKQPKLSMAPLRYARVSALFGAAKGDGGPLPRGLVHLLFSAVCLATLYSVASLSSRSLAALRSHGRGPPWDVTPGRTGDVAALWASSLGSTADVLGWAAGGGGGGGGSGGGGGGPGDAERRATDQLRSSLRAQFGLPGAVVRRLGRGALEELHRRLRGPDGAPKTAVVAVIGADFASRVRALGLCMAFAAETDRVLVVDWVRDGFLYPSFGELFASHAGFLVLAPEGGGVDGAHERDGARGEVCAGGAMMGRAVTWNGHVGQPFLLCF